jgi:hypothetical protein
MKGGSMKSFFRFLIGVAILALLVLPGQFGLTGCGVTVSIRTDPITKQEIVEAKGCDSFLKKDGVISCISKPWFSMNFITDLLNGLFKAGVK